MSLLRNFKLLLCYDGTNVDGWQKQGNTDNTIQGRLENILSGILHQPVEVHGSGRTDAGVHANGQVANFKAHTDLPASVLKELLRKALPESIGLYELEEVDLRFHSRLNARRKTYIYRIWNSEAPCVFERRYVWTMREPLDWNAMQKAAAALCGTHDFRSFCANKQMKKSTIRTLERLEIRQEAHELVLTFTGDGFLYHMVRILVGTLVEVGQGTRSPDSMPELLAAKNRATAGFTAPARGLTLWEVSY